MVTNSIVLYIVIAVLTLVVAGLVYVLVILNSSKYETKREFEVRLNQKFKKDKMRGI